MSPRNTTIRLKIQQHTMKAGLLYTKCALRCQEWLTFFTLLHKVCQASTGAPTCVPRHITSWSTSQALYLSVRNLVNHESIGQETLPAVRRLLVDWQFSQSPGGRQKMKIQSAASALGWVEGGKKKRKRFSIGAKNSNVFIGNCVFLPISSPCANENSPVIKTPVSSANRGATLAASSLLFLLWNVFSEGKNMQCEIRKQRACSRRLQRPGIVVIMNFVVLWLEGGHGQVPLPLWPASLLAGVLSGGVMMLCAANVTDIYPVSCMSYRHDYIIRPFVYLCQIISSIKHRPLRSAPTYASLTFCSHRSAQTTQAPQS